MNYFTDIVVTQIDTTGSFSIPVVGIICLVVGIIAFARFATSKGSVEQTVRALEISLASFGMGCILIYCFIPSGQYTLQKESISLENAFVLAEDFEVVESTEETIIVAPKGFVGKVTSHIEAIRWNKVE